MGSRRACRLLLIEEQLVAIKPCAFQVGGILHAQTRVPEEQNHRLDLGPYCPNPTSARADSSSRSALRQV
jgi:hypothetical protein